MRHRTYPHPGSLQRSPPTSAPPQTLPAKLKGMLSASPNRATRAQVHRDAG